MSGIKTPCLLSCFLLQFQVYLNIKGCSAKICGSGTRIYGILAVYFKLGIMMEAITRHSVIRAADEAVQLWALASAQYPKQHDLILEVDTTSIIEVISAFALNARRALEALPPSEKFPLAQARWQWVPRAGGEVVSDLWDALNRIIHAQKLEVGFEQLPSSVSVIDGGALAVPYIRAATDRKKLAFIDPFALSHAFLYGAYPKLVAIRNAKPTKGTH